jgi:hypothetical protein
MESYQEIRDALYLKILTSLERDRKLKGLKKLSGSRRWVSNKAVKIHAKAASKCPQ